MTTQTLTTFRAVLGLAAAGVALLSAPAASAQAPLPLYAFTVNNYTAQSGPAAYPVYDSVDFNNLQVNEVFADGFGQAVALSAATIGEGDSTFSGLQTLTSLPGGGYSDAVHGALTSAVLSGALAFPGFTPTDTLSLTVQPTADPSSAYSQLVYTSFSASLLGPAPAGVPVGTFSLLNLGSNAGTTVDINAPLAPAPVPEASTTVSLGLMLALGLGGVAVARRKRVAA